MKTHPRGGEQHPGFADRAQMLNWRVPIDLPQGGAVQTTPIARLEEDGRVYALTGYVRHVRFQADCDYHVQVAGSAAAGASR